MTSSTPSPPERTGPGMHRPAQLPSLTGLRFLAALCVFAFHMTLSASPIPPNHPISPFADQRVADDLEWLFGKAGYLGVSFFFVLSGFVLTWSHRPTTTTTAFWRRRLMKIFPNHLVMWALAMLTFAAAITPSRAWLPNLFLLHSFSPDGSVYVAVNPPSWTLCSELLFYLAFPIFIALLRRIRPARLWYWATVMVLGMIAVQVINLALIPATPRSAITPVSVTQFWFGYIFPVPRMFEFVLGAVLALIVINGRFPRLRVRHAVGLLALGYLAALELPFVWGFNVATIVGVGGLIGSVAVADVQGRHWVLSNRRMVWLGEISFGFYLCQGVVVFYGRILTGEHTYATPVAVSVVAGFFVATLMAGWALFEVVERPMMRRYARSRRPVRIDIVPEPRPVPAA